MRPVTFCNTCVSNFSRCYLSSCEGLFLRWFMWCLETEGAFWRSTYLFCCSYFEWLYCGCFLWCTSLTYFPSSLVFHPVVLQLCVIRARGGAGPPCVCHWLLGQLVEKEVSGFTSYHHSGLPEGLTMITCIVQLLSTFLNCLFLLEYVYRYVHVWQLRAKLWSRKFACWA